MPVKLEAEERGWITLANNFVRIIIVNMYW